MTLMMTLMTIMIIGNASRATCRVDSLLYFVEFCCLPVLSHKSKANGYKSREVDRDRGKSPENSYSRRIFLVLNSRRPIIRFWIFTLK